jgi:hypothetical protein
MPESGIIDAVVVVSEVQLRGPTTGCVVPSLRRIAAVKFSVWPTAIVGFAGVICTETRTAPTTVNVDGGEVIEPRLAVMSEVPTVSVEARPAVEIVATASVAEFHVT